MLQATHLIGFGAFTAAGVAAAPSVLGTNSGTSAGNDRVPALFDAAASSGQLLLVICSMSHGGTIGGLDPAAGYTQIFDTTVNTKLTHAAFYKVAAGGETGADFLTDTAAAGNGAFVAYRIGGFTGTPEGAVTTGGAEPANSPNLTPSWGSALNLWLTTDASDSTSGANPTVPTNYANAVHVSADDGAAGVAHKLSVARRDLTAASENPGAWGNNGGADWVAATIAVRPA